MEKLSRYLYVVLSFASSWYFGYFIMLDGPQGGHGDLELLLAVVFAVATFLVGMIWSFLFFKKRISKHSLALISFLSVFSSLATFPLVLVAGFFFSKVLKPVYCKIDPSSPSAFFDQRCKTSSQSE